MNEEDKLGIKDIGGNPLDSKFTLFEFSSFNFNSC